MSQSANSAINFDLSNISMWNGGDAVGFDLATIQHKASGLLISTDLVAKQTQQESPYFYQS
ncbi:MAG: hypothetical protein U1E99_05910 [Agitococcus sp.]